MTPNQVQLLGGIADNFLFRVLVGRKHVQQVPQWYGETVGFWDGDTLITWTSNVQGWFTHSSWEYSNQMQLIEIWTPRKFADGKFAGLEHETIFYNPKAFVQPVRDIRFFSRHGWRLR